MQSPKSQVTPLRQRMIENMRMRHLAPKTQEAYIRAVYKLTAFTKKSHDTASARRCAVSSRSVHITEGNVCF